MSVPAKSANVCGACRSRKKKCDGARPACSPCLKRGAICLYPAMIGDQNAMFGNAGWFPDAAADMLPADMSWQQTMSDDVLMNFALGNSTPMTPTRGSNNVPQTSNYWNGFQPTAAESFPTPESSGSGLAVESSVPSLPPLEELLDVVEFFFERFYDSLPIIHKHTLLSTLRDNGADGVPIVLLYALLAITSTSYPNPRIRQNSHHWYALAKSELTKMMASSEHTHQTLQAALLVVFETIMKAEFNNTWLILGEAWRKAVATGYSEDASFNSKITFMLGGKKEKSWIEREECRRIAWALFIFDRGLCFPIGVVHAIDDRRLAVRFPMSEDAFQGINEPEDEENMMRHSRNLDRLITSVQERVRNGTGTQLQYIILAYILLGRVTEEVYSPEFDYEKQRAELDTLTKQLVRIRLVLPHSAVDVGAAGYGGSASVIWLVAILNSASILLHHRPLREGETLETSTDMASNWPHCIRAARDVVRTIRDASRAGSDGEIASHVTTALFLCFRMLVLEYLYPLAGGPKVGGAENAVSKRNPVIRADIEVIAGVFEKLKDSRQELGKKYHRGAKLYLSQDEAAIRETMSLGARDLLTTCESWMEQDDGPIVIRD